jgi:hypothetical protein
MHVIMPICWINWTKINVLAHPVDLKEYTFVYERILFNKEHMHKNSRQKQRNIINLSDFSVKFGCFFFLNNFRINLSRPIWQNIKPTYFMFSYSLQQTLIVDWMSTVK